jgi:hypothetical protein
MKEEASSLLWETAAIIAPGANARSDTKVNFSAQELLSCTTAEYHASMLRALLVAVLCTAFAIGQQPTAPPQSQAPEFGDAEGAQVLHDFAGALEGHSLRRFLALFDENSYPDFAVFSGEMDSYFGRYDQFRVHYNLKQTGTNADGHGVLLAQVQLEELPIDTGEVVRRTTTLSFELVHVNGKWKIASFHPREFLS